MRVRPRTDADVAAVESFLDANHSFRVARLGEVLRAIDHPALVADDGSRLVGLLTYVIAGDDCEILTLHAAEQWRGTGSALVDAVARGAVEHGCSRLWLLTTNDNVDALRFYQRRGFRLTALHPGAVDQARRQLKPEIPEIGAHGIPIRDELILERRLEVPR
jgi:GNAT superfamily N-acetyltransferase